MFDRGETMIRIAVVDDDKKLCSKIDRDILAYAKVSSKAIDVEVLYSGEKFKNFILTEHDFDLIFLDIQMDDIDGIEIGHFLRDELNDNLVQIVYITSLKNRDRELFSIRPMNFIAKPVETEKIVETLDTYYKLFRDMDKMFMFTSERQHLKIAYDKIICFKSDDKKVYLYTEDKGKEDKEKEDGSENKEDKEKEVKSKVYTFYGRLSDIAENLPFQFISVHKSYIINKFYVVRYNYDSVIMTDNTRIPISQKNQKNVRRLLMQHNKEAGEEYFVES